METDVINWESLSQSGIGIPLAFLAMVISILGYVQTLKSARLSEWMAVHKLRFRLITKLNTLRKAYVNEHALFLRLSEQGALSSEYREKAGQIASTLAESISDLDREMDQLASEHFGKLPLRRLLHEDLKHATVSQDDTETRLAYITELQKRLLSTGILSGKPDSKALQSAQHEIDQWSIEPAHSTTPWENGQEGTST